MSQYGALGYAQHGWTHTSRSSSHYYTDTSIGLLPPATTERVLLSSGRAQSLHVTLGGRGRRRRRRPAAGGGQLPGRRRGRWRATCGCGAWPPARYVLDGDRQPDSDHPRSEPLRLDDTAVNGFGGDHWWGDFRIIRSGGSLMLVNLVRTEKYVRERGALRGVGVVAGAALQTQAVAARSYAVATRNPAADYDAYRRHPQPDVLPDRAAGARLRRGRRRHPPAGGDVRRQVAITFFSSSSGGRTSSISASWGGTDQPYLVPVNDRYDGAGGLNPNHTWAPKRYTRARPRPPRSGSAMRWARSTTTVDGPSQRVLSVDAHTAARRSPPSLRARCSSRLGLRSTYFRLLQVSLSAPAAITAGDTFSSAAGCGRSRERVSPAR